MSRGSLGTLLGLAMTIGVAQAAVDRPPTPQESFAARWQGAWVVTGVATFSDCVGFYTDNVVHSGLLTSHGHHRFAAGMPAHVDSVDVSADAMRLRLTLAEMLVVSRVHPEFTLRAAARCQVEVQVDLPDGTLRHGDLMGMESMLQPVVERYGNMDQALLVSNFLPADTPIYAAQRNEAVASHEEWKERQSAEMVDARMEEWVDQTTRLSGQISSDPDYLDGFARGVSIGRSSTVTQCTELMKVEPASQSLRGPASTVAVAASSGKRQKSWSRGYQDGLRLAQGLEAIRVLPQCAPSGVRNGSRAGSPSFLPAAAHSSAGENR